MRYEDVDIDEALDLAFSLPSGSQFISALCPARSWPLWRHAIADLQDEMWAILFARFGRDDPPRVTRPAQKNATERAVSKAKRTRDYIESTEWKSV